MFQFVLIAAALFLAFPPDDVFASPRPTLGVAIPGAPSRFRLVKQKKSWDDAEAYCRQSAGHLATFVDLEEYQSVISPLFNMCKNEGWKILKGWNRADIWIGARGIGKGGAGFEQVDATPFPFKKKGQNPWFGGGVGPTDVNFAFPIFDDNKWCVSVIIGYKEDRGLVVDHAMYEGVCDEDRFYPWFLCEL